MFTIISAYTPSQITFNNAHIMGTIYMCIYIYIINYVTFMLVIFLFCNLYLRFWPWSLLADNIGSYKYISIYLYILYIWIQNILFTLRFKLFVFLHEKRHFRNVLVMPKVRIFSCFLCFNQQLDFLLFSIAYYWKGRELSWFKTIGASHSTQYEIT